MILLIWASFYGHIGKGSRRWIQFSGFYMQPSEFMKICEKNDVQVIIGGPYNSGILARDLNSPVSYNYEVAPKDLIIKAKNIERTTNKFNVSLKSAALNFVLKNTQVFSVVPGMSSINEVRDNIQIANEAMPEELWASLSKYKFI